MSAYLWKYYLQDDFDQFRLFLDKGGGLSRSHTQKGLGGGQNIAIGSPGGYVASPPAATKWTMDVHAPHLVSDTGLTRADINRRDGKGLTILHHAVSSTSESSKQFALALIAHPLIDLYAQDFENGWTSLHRAFYFGNITLAQAILERDGHNPLGQAGTGSSQPANLIKIKDREGNGPYDILTATIRDRTLPSYEHGFGRKDRGQFGDEDEEDALRASVTDLDGAGQNMDLVEPLVNLQGDEFYTFGSNKNINLGLGNEDDRQYPEKVSLRRPQHLYQKFYREYVNERISSCGPSHSEYAERLRQAFRESKQESTLPAIIAARPVVVQDVQMSKFHTAVLTADPESNLFVCGHGLGGRLGTGDEKTRFHFVCIQDPVLIHKRIVSVALGQDHTIAITSDGGVFTWGSNVSGQLGCGISKSSQKPEDNTQLVPKQLFGPLKRELVTGAAASRIHSVVHTPSSLYVFGKNEGQLGITDARAGQLSMIDTPRKVAASRFSSGIQSVSAIDRATICLLENDEVHVFANYGIVKLQFHLDGFTNYFLKKSFLATRYDDTPNRIIKVTCGGDTICSLTSAGEIFSVTVEQTLDPDSSQTTSTTNPNKIKGALSSPSRIWSLKKGHMNARDVGVDQDGSIILTTEAGSVWRRVRRPKPPGSSKEKTLKKDYKFSRVPGLTRILAVRASGSGAYCAIRNDCDVTRTQLLPKVETLWNDLLVMVSFKDFAPSGQFIASDNAESTGLKNLVSRLAQSKDLESELSQYLAQKASESINGYDILLASTVTEVKIPVHKFVLAGRSKTMRTAIATMRAAGSYIDEIFSMQPDPDNNSKTLLTFRGLDFLTLLELTLYLYCDGFVGFWHQSRKTPTLAHRYRQVRSEVMKIAAHLDLPDFESAARRMIQKADVCLDKDFDLALDDPEFLAEGDAILELSDGELSIHSELASRRCPFFEGLFQGRAQGRWLAERRELLEDASESVPIDMKHIDVRTFKIVMRHIYAGVGEELFDDFVTQDLDELIDLVMDVLSVANELMLDRLSQVCQKVLGRYVNARNICQLLNAVAPCSITNFKDAGLEYLCLNLESMLSSRALDELDEDLLCDLDEVVRANQLATLPFAKSGRAEALLHERHPQLAAIMDRDRQAKIDAITLQVKFLDQSIPLGASFEGRDNDRMPLHQNTRKPRRYSGETSVRPLSSAHGTQSDSIMMFEMTVDDELPSTPSSAMRPVRQMPSYEEESGWTQVGSKSPIITAKSVNSPESSFKASFDGKGKSPATPSRPWGPTPLSTPKLGIKDIMDQASTSRTSNLTMSMSLLQQADSSSSPSFNMRMSQKERRKQSQQSQPQTNIGSLQDDSSSPTPKSPWQQVSKSKSTPISSGEVASPSQSPATPQMTMRQTVANTKGRSVSGVEGSRSQIKAPSTPQSRSVSTPQSPKPSSQSRPSSNTGGFSASTTSPLPIQSIRHQAQSRQGSSSPDSTAHGHYSLADILSQQQAEKDVIREVITAKHNLQDIQTEQEFQQWWDQESRRVQMEAEAASDTRESGPGRGRGGKSRRGRPRKPANKTSQT